MSNRPDAYTVVEDVITRKYLLQKTSSVYSYHIDAWVTSTFTVETFDNHDDAWCALQRIRGNNNSRYREIHE